MSSLSYKLERNDKGNSSLDKGDQYYSKEYVEDIEQFYKREREDFRLKII